MKPRRIPAKAERVYTYRLDRLPKKNHANSHSERDSAVGNGQFDALNDNTKTAHEEPQKSDPVKKIPQPETKPKKKRLYSWGAPVESGDRSFYDEMLEHETGDPTPDEKTIASRPHLTHTGEVPQLAKTDYLNTDIDGTLVQDESNGLNEQGLQGELPSPFPDGDAHTRYFPRDKA